MIFLVTGSKISLVVRDQAGKQMGERIMAVSSNRRCQNGSNVWINS